MIKHNQKWRNAESLMTKETTRSVEETENETDREKNFVTHTPRGLLGPAPSSLLSLPALVPSVAADPGKTTHSPPPPQSVSSVAQSCPTLCDLMNRSTPGLPVHHQLPEFTQTHVHGVGDAIQPSHPLSSPSPPTPNPSQHQGLFQ